MLSLSFFVGIIAISGCLLRRIFLQNVLLISISVYTIIYSLFINLFIHNFGRIYKLRLLYLRLNEQNLVI